jgi:hypothetical protein
MLPDSLEYAAAEFWPMSMLFEPVVPFWNAWNPIIVFSVPVLFGAVRAPMPTLRGPPLCRVLAPIATFWSALLTLSVPKPTAVFSNPEVLLAIELLPMAVFQLLAVSCPNAFSPTATLRLPVVFARIAFEPTAVLEPPVVLDCKARAPTATPQPVVVFKNASEPSAVMDAMPLALAAAPNPTAV